MKKPMMVIINPNAGRGGYRFGVAEGLNMFYNAGWLPHVYFTEARGDGTRIAREHGGEYERVVCVGGDGTLSEVVAGIVTLPDAPPIGYIPMGSTNDVASTLGISSNPLDAAETILNGKPMSLDVGAFGETDFFTYIAAFGAFTEVSYATAQSLKQSLGHFAYILEGMKQLPKIDHRMVRVEYDGGVIEEDLVFGGVMNSLSMGGMLKFTEGLVDLSDGLFEVILVRNPKNLVELNNIVTCILNRNYDGHFVSVLHGSQVRFTFDKPTAWTRDGENGGEFTDVLIENRRKAIRIIA